MLLYYIVLENNSSIIVRNQVVSRNIKYNIFLKLIFYNYLTNRKLGSIIKNIQI